MQGLRYAGIGVLLACLTACLGLPHQAEFKAAEQKYQDVSPECQDAVTKCLLPVVLPYAYARDPSEAFEIMRNIELEDHCRRNWETLTCLQGLVGKKQCSDIDPKILKVWYQFLEPILDDASTYICNREFKKFNIHYRCLLTEEVIYAPVVNCSSVKSDPSEEIACIGGVVKEECGSTAAQITETLLQRLLDLIEDAKKAEDRDDDDDDDDDDELSVVEPLLAPLQGYDVFPRQLSVLKKLLTKK